MSERAQLAVMGSPIAHSKSPAIHAAAYRALGLDWAYSRHECVASELEQALAWRPWRGLSLTMPLKERAFELAVHTDEVATLTRTVNTLFREDATQPWRGWNTDVGGLAKVLEDFTCDAQHTIVLGTGATAISALLAAKARGARTATIVGRRAEAVEALVQRFAGIGRDHPLEVRGCLFTDHDAMTAHVQAASLIVSSLPGSACENLTLPADTERLPLVDVAYDPWPSPLAKRWHENGGSAYSGVEMLVNQALLQVRVFVSGDVKNALPEEARVFAAMREAANSQV